MVGFLGTLRTISHLTTIVGVVGLLAACQPFGPSRSDVLAAGRVPATAAGAESAIEVVRVGTSTVSRIRPALPAPAFASALAGAVPIGTVVGVGDALEVSIWEAPPATLFGGGAAVDTRIGTGIATARPTVLPEALIGPEGYISVPFAGRVPATGRTLRAIENDITSRLRGRANAPQVLVRLVRNATANVTVVGEVNQGGRVPLSPRGERLLDALAAAGGVKPAVNLATVQVTRDGNIYRMLLSEILERSENNVVLARDDVVTVLFQPYSFTVLGATGRNEEVRFEAMGITMAQALGRVGGLQDGRSDPRGVFVFRWEEPETPGGLRKPVIYSFELSDPAAFFVLQQFPMQDQDLLYITNSPVTELQRFVGLVASTIIPLATVSTVVP